MAFPLRPTVACCGTKNGVELIDFIQKEDLLPKIEKMPYFLFLVDFTRLKKQANNSSGIFLHGYAGHIPTDDIQLKQLANENSLFDFHTEERNNPPIPFHRQDKLQQKIEFENHPIQKQEQDKYHQMEQWQRDQKKELEGYGSVSVFLCWRIN